MGKWYQIADFWLLRMQSYKLFTGSLSLHGGFFFFLCLKILFFYIHYMYLFLIAYINFRKGFVVIFPSCICALIKKKRHKHEDRPFYLRQPSCTTSCLCCGTHRNAPLRLTAKSSWSTLSLLFVYSNFKECILYTSKEKIIKVELRAKKRFLFINARKGNLR
jgi:hypothetical protein